MKYVWLSISLFLTGLVFAMSLQTQETSGQMSFSITQYVYDYILRIVPSMTWSIDTFHSIIRKSAHVIEYMFLGISWFFTFRSFRLNHVILILLGVFIALFDESIQFFIEGRGPSLIDVFIFDYCGYLLGLWLSHLTTKN